LIAPYHTSSIKGTKILVIFVKIIAWLSFLIFLLSESQVKLNAGLQTSFFNLKLYYGL